MELAEREGLEAARRALRRANRALLAVNAANRELLRAHDESRFLFKICAIMIEVGGYKMAWIGAKANDAAKSVIPAAKAGLAGDYLKRVKITWADQPEGQGPTGAAIRSMKAAINRDSASEVFFAPWREEALKRGYASSGAFPIVVDGACHGALMVYSAEKDAFDQDEIDLLSGLALDAGFGISVIREKRSRIKAEHERRLIEEKLLHTQKMESLGLLASGVAHDFNNLLSTIMLNLDLARMGPPEDANAHINRAMEASRRSAEICRQMLTYAGRGGGDRRAVDLNRVIREMTGLLSASLSKKISLILDLCPGARPALADVSQVRQAALNLIVNAAEAIGPVEGSVTIRTREIQCGEIGDFIFRDPDLGQETCLLLEVEDTGCGMDPDTAQKAFDPFYTTKPAGRGIGLAVALGVAKGNGGAISVESRKGKGSIFRLLLPMDIHPGLVEIEPKNDPGGFAPSGTILVVEDEEHLRNACQIALSMSGYNVLCAANGQEGLKIISERPDEICLVILDLSMPVMDGRETLDAMKARGERAPVILTSGYDKSMTVTMPDSDLIVSFLGKPYSAGDLVRAVRAVADTRRKAGSGMEV